MVSRTDASSSVQRSATSTSVVASLRSHFMVDAQQQREEVRVLQEGMAHCDGSSLGRKETLPQGPFVQDP
jgi:hypothetical protein